MSRAAAARIRYRWARHYVRATVGWTVRPVRDAARTLRTARDDAWRWAAA